MPYILVVFVVSESPEADGLQSACWHSSLWWFTATSWRSFTQLVWCFSRRFCHKVQQWFVSFLCVVCFANES